MGPGKNRRPRQTRPKGLSDARRNCGLEIDNGATERTQRYSGSLQLSVKPLALIGSGRSETAEGLQKGYVAWTAQNCAARNICPIPPTPASSRSRYLCRASDHKSECRLTCCAGHNWDSTKLSNAAGISSCPGPSESSGRSYNLPRTPRKCRPPRPGSAGSVRQRETKSFPSKCPVTSDSCASPDIWQNSGNPSLQSLK